MQKKSLLVALFCGALCLTGCLKNEESASVALVRGAKAEELKSLAALNNAKAAAEAVYAEAELTVAKAEAELRKAQAALILAQAETEKVSAELLKVQVALEEVKVDEERVELQRKEAELEKLLAQVEAAKAQAEADKQEWVNKLENLLAQAEVDAINNAKALLEAQEKLEEYVLTLEKAHADSAQKAATNYFAALEDVQDLQKQQLQVKATKALVEAGALTVRDAIHYEMDKIDEEIAEKEAYIAYLKEYQTLTPEEAEEKYQAAAKAAGEAYTALTEKMQAVTEAETALTTLNDKTADFTHGWNSNFANDIENNSEIKRNVIDWYLPINFGEGENAITRMVKTTIFVIPGEEVGDFEVLPLWNAEKNSDKVYERYPDVDVYTPTGFWTGKEFTILEKTLIAPASINYDNVKVALDTAVARKEASTTKAIADAQKSMETSISNAQKSIKANEAKMELHKKYVEARKEKVAAAEAAYIAALGKETAYKTAKKNAWNAFQEYMLINHDESRLYFIEQNKADSAYVQAVNDTVAPYNALVGAVEGIPALVELVEPAHVAAEEAIGEYRVAQYAFEHPGTVLAIKKEKLINAYADWSPEFDAAPGKPNHDPEDLATADDTTWWKGTAQNKIWAKPKQNALLNAQLASDTAEKEYYLADMDYKRNPDGSAQGTRAKARFDAADERLEICYGILGDKQEDEEEAAKTYAKAKDDVEDDIKATLVLANGQFSVFSEDYNPNFDVRNWVTFPLPEDAHIDPSTPAWKVQSNALDEDGEWIEEILENAGESQLALMNAVKDVVDAIDNVKELRGKYFAAKRAYNAARGNLFSKNRALMVALGAEIPPIDEFESWEEYVEYIDEHIAEYVDAKAVELYQAYKAIEKEESEFTYEDLLKVYTVAPDSIGTLVLGTNPFTGEDYRVAPVDLYEDKDGNDYYGWLISSYQIDYKATYVKEGGERAPIAEYLYEKVGGKPDYTKSLKYKSEQLQKNIDETYPEEFETAKTRANNGLNRYKREIADLLAAVNAYKSDEAGYKSWVADREKAEAAVNEAKKAEFEAKKVKIDAEANYKAACAALNGGVIYEIWDTNRDGIFGYNKVSINEAIALLEGDVDAYQTGVSALFEIAATIQGQIDDVIDEKKVTIEELQSAYEALKNIDKKLPDGSIAELNFTKKVLEETLKAGKVSLQIIIDAFDEQLAVLDEKIEVYTALVNTYKAIMNAYLGIVDEADAEGETGPLDGEGEGDDEE